MLYKILIVQNYIYVNLKNYMSKMRYSAVKNINLTVRCIWMKFILIKDKCWIFGIERKFQQDKRMRLVDYAPYHSFLSTVSFSRSFILSCSLVLLLFFLVLSLVFLCRVFSLSVSPSIHSDRSRNYYFLTSTKRLIHQRSIYRTLRWHRTSANGTANGCVLLVPLHLPHYTQFSAGDLIGFSLILLLRSLPVRSSLPIFFSLFFFFILYRLYVITCTIGRKITFFWRFWLTRFLNFYHLTVLL